MTQAIDRPTTRRGAMLAGAAAFAGAVPPGVVIPAVINATGPDKQVLRACAAFFDAHELRIAVDRGQDSTGLPYDWSDEESALVMKAWDAAVAALIETPAHTARGLAEKAQAMQLAFWIDAAPLAGFTFDKQIEPHDRLAMSLATDASRLGVAA